MRFSFDPAKRASNRDVLVAIVTAESQDHIRIISMRKAERHEQAIYRENLS